MPDASQQTPNGQPSAKRHVIVFDRQMVLCDGCNADHTDQSQIGGIIVGSHAMCPVCTARQADTIAEDRKEHPRYILDPNPNETFGDFVRRVRNPQGSNLIVIHNG